MSAGAPAVTRRSVSPEATEQAGAVLAPQLRDGDVVALEGPLGSGKTCFVGGLARGLGSGGRVRSPSFTLVNEYPGSPRLFHVDLYRLTAEEAAGLGLEEMVGRGALVAEWGERLPAMLSADALHLRFEIVSVGERSIAGSATGPRGLALLAAWSEAKGSTGPGLPPAIR